MPTLITRRLTVLFCVCALLAACGSDDLPHSDYFVVGFLPNTPALSDGGLDALDHAVKQAGRRAPSFIVVSAAVPESGTLPELAQQRIAAVTQAFVRGGVDLRLIRNETRAYGAKSYAERKDGVILQLAYGTPPP